jgi:hypothetical protein
MVPKPPPADPPFAVNVTVLLLLIEPLAAAAKVTDCLL